MEMLASAFLIDVKVNTLADAYKNARRAALQRNPTYAAGVCAERRALVWSDISKFVGRQLPGYIAGIPEDEHTSLIAELADDISRRHPDAFLDKRFRIGTAQKFVNLLVKFQWCIELRDGRRLADPPHCPLDRVVLKSAGLGGKWTKLDSIETYREWIDHLKGRSSGQLARWELREWRRVRAT